MPSVTRTMSSQTLGATPHTQSEFGKFKLNDSGQPLRMTGVLLLGVADPRANVVVPRLFGDLQSCTATPPKGRVGDISPLGRSSGGRTVACKNLKFKITVRL